MTKKLKTSVEELIDVVKEYPVLYDRANNVSSAQANEEKSMAWKKIAEFLDDDVTSLKAKWRNLRDSYQKAIKNRKELEEIGQLHRYHEYKHEGKLDFLYPHLDLEPNLTRKRKASSCYSPSSKSMKNTYESILQEPSNYQIEYLEHVPVEQQESEDGEEGVQEESLNRVDETNDNEYCYEFENDQQQQQQQLSNIITNTIEEPKSDIDVWLESVKASMLKLTKLNQARAKRDINSILSNYEIEQLENNS